ncbi:MAG TPA: helix-turn-helix transcriptional regulator, partial [Solirubrobacteraceae bacterium]|nr:helix-turn-helix transcriptional regulator [Solirubrobacteraceae bacterium]
VADQALAELRAGGSRPRRAARSGTAALTPSERRVAKLAAAGLASADIAQRLFVSRKTVETHLQRCYRKLGIHSRRELARLFDADASRSAV